MQQSNTPNDNKKDSLSVPGGSNTSSSSSAPLSPSVLTNRLKRLPAAPAAFGGLREEPSVPDEVEGAEGAEGAGAAEQQQGEKAQEKERVRKKLDEKEVLPIEVIRRLPKAELHLHLDGSVRVSTIIALAKEQGVQLPSFDLKELTSLVEVGENCSSLVEYLRAFDIVLSVLQKPYAITRVMYEVCEDCVKDGVKYVEVRFSPILHTKDGMSLSQVMEAICEGQMLAESRLPIFARIIVCGMRHLSPSDTEKLAEIAWRYRSKGVNGFDLAGPEHGFRSKHHKSAFDIIRHNSLNCTLHAGEAAGPESIQDSLRWCGAHRIGHGVTLRKDPRLLQYVIDRRVPIECCITSNLQTKAIRRLEEHPMREYLDAGVIVVPCCDNKTMSSVTLSGEYALYQRLFGFSIAEMLRLIDNGFQSAFMQSTRKQRLRAEVLFECLTVLTEEGYDVSEIVNGSRFWDCIGVDFSLFSPKATAKHYYWGGHENPDITLDIVRNLPKADLNCRLDGSINISLLWKEIQDAGINCRKVFGVPFSSEEDVKKFIYPELHTRESWEICKQLFNVVLQNEGQIQRAIEDIFSTAQKDNVKYMELMVRPRAHTAGGMSEIEVIECILDAKEKLEKETGVRCGVVLYARIGLEDPMHFFHVAQLAVEYRDHGVCGFGVLGERELNYNEFEFYQHTFDYLKRNSMNIVMFSGKTNTQNIIAALHDGGAWRISGAFQAHTDPTLMGYIANHSIPVELQLTDDNRKHLYPHMHTFSGHPLRMFIDNNVPITLCSFKQTLALRDRSQAIHDVITECKLSVSEMLKLLQNGFRYNFQVCFISPLLRVLSSFSPLLLPFFILFSLSSLLV
ncbi:Adenosine deaminase [Balamuthia mandrillaris]